MNIRVARTALLLGALALSGLTDKGAAAQDQGYDPLAYARTRPRTWYWPTRVGPFPPIPAIPMPSTTSSWTR